jgi:hypothetical protein
MSKIARSVRDWAPRVSGVQWMDSVSTIFESLYDCRGAFFSVAVTMLSEEGTQLISVLQPS